MPPEMAAKYKDVVRLAVVAQAKDGRWAHGKKEAEVRALKKGAFDTAAEAAADAANTNDIIVNTAPPVAPPKKRVFADVVPKKLVKADLAELEHRVASHEAGKNTKGKEAAMARARTKPALPPAPKKGGAPRGKGIGAFCEGLILAGKSDAEVLAAVAKQFPDAKTKEASVNWYRNKLKREGQL